MKEHQQERENENEKQKPFALGSKTVVLIAVAGIRGPATGTLPQSSVASTLRLFVGMLLASYVGDRQFG